MVMGMGPSTLREIVFVLGNPFPIFAYYRTCITLPHWFITYFQSFNDLDFGFISQVDGFLGVLFVFFRRAVRSRNAARIAVEGEA